MHNYLINVCGLCVQEAYLLVQTYRNVQFAKDGVDSFVIRVRGQASPIDGCMHLQIEGPGVHAALEKITLFSRVLALFLAICRYSPQSFPFEGDLPSVRKFHPSFSGSAWICSFVPHPCTLIPGWANNCTQWNNIAFVAGSCICAPVRKGFKRCVLRCPLLYFKERKDFLH